MRLLERVSRLFGITFGVPGANTYDYSQAWLRGDPMPCGTDAVLRDPYAEHPVVAKALPTIAEDAAGVGWELYPAGGSDDEDAIEDDPLLDLWEKPNAFMSGSDLWVATYALFKLHGEVLWYYPELQLGVAGGLKASRASAGELLVLDCSNIRIKADGGTLGYSIQTRTGLMPLDVDRLTHFKRFNPAAPLRGLSELAALKIELDSDHNAATWNRNLFGEQAGVPAGMIETAPGGINYPKPERDDFLQSFNARHARRRAVGMLPAGMKYNPIGLSPQDMSFRELREYSREITLGLFGLPPFQAGVLDKANYANAREQKDVYWHGTITRLLNYFQSKLNADFLPKIGRADVEAWPCWEKVKALTENLEEKSRIAKELFALGFTRRQINERLELGFDPDEWEDADVSYLPFSLAPASSLSEDRTAAGAVASQPGDGDTTAPPPRQLTNGAGRAAPDSLESRRAMVWKAVISNTRDLDMRFTRLVRSHFSAIEREVLGNLAGLKGWLIAERKEALYGELFDKPAAKRKLARASEPIYRATIQRGVESIIAELDLGTVWDATDPRVLGKIAELSGKITRIDDTIETQIRAALREGTEAGEGAAALAKRVEAVFDAGRARAVMIARTESGQAFSFGRDQEMRDARVTRHEWLAARDDRVREEHEAEDGNVVSLGETFPVTGLRYPLESTGPAEEIINCRCVAIPVIEAEA